MKHRSWFVWNVSNCLFIVGKYEADDNRDNDYHDDEHNELLELFKIAYNVFEFVLLPLEFHDVVVELVN